MLCWTNNKNKPNYVSFILNLVSGNRKMQCTTRQTVTFLTSANLSFKVPFLSSVNEVSTGPTCQFVYLCFFVSLYGLFFMASNWLIYWFLTVVLAPYLSKKVFWAWLISATLRFFKATSNEEELKNEDGLKKKTASKLRTNSLTHKLTHKVTYGGRHAA